MAQYFPYQSVGEGECAVEELCALPEVLVDVGLRQVGQPEALVHDALLGVPKLDKLWQSNGE